MAKYIISIEDKLIGEDGVKVTITPAADPLVKKAKAAQKSKLIVLTPAEGLAVIVLGAIAKVKQGLLN